MLTAAGYRVHMPSPAGWRRARCSCCGRTFLSAGLVDEARGGGEARVVETYAPFVARGVPVVGLEPSCLLTFRDELPSRPFPARRRSGSPPIRC